MTPKHAKTSYFLKQGLFNNLKSFSDLEKRISKLLSEKERGDAFEVFAEAYLATQTIMLAKEVFPFDKIPPPVKRKYRLDTKKDMGVDGLLQTTLDENHAYQVKFRSGRPPLTWRELSTFVGSSKKTEKGLVFTNCNVLPSNVDDMEEVYSVRGNDLDRLEPEDFQQILNWLKKTPKPKPRKEPREYQQEAIEAIEKALKGSTSKRATAVMACGTGKTLIALWVAERLGYKKILVLVPSLALLSQTLHEWMKETSWENLSYLCVCSDPTVTKGADNWVVKQSDVDFPVGTDSQTVREFLAKRTGGVKVVFSTYQSAEVVADGMDGKPFDLGIFDEAHKTAGREGTKFGFALDDENLPIKRRLFLTATPRHYNVQKKDKEGESKLVYSMDDIGTFGKRVYELPFFNASQRGIICDYKVLISVITSNELPEELLSKSGVIVQGQEVRARQVASQLALKRATEDYTIKKAFTFHTLVSSAESFTAEGAEGLQAHLPSFEAFHVSGAMPTAKREELLHEFENSKRAVMSNARCLTEGVNIPVVDMVAFMSPKKSKVDIVQATGRAMRKAGRKKKGYILIPLFLQETKKESLEEAVERTDFNEVWDVLQAMKEQDAELAEIISQMVVEQARTGAKGYDDQWFREKVETLGSDVSLDVLRRSITARCIEKLGNNWDVMYGQLVTYKEKHGHCNVPDSYENGKLGTWVGIQRQTYRKSKLSEDKVQKLEALGFVWYPYEAYWEDMYKRLIEFKETYGHCNVPRNDENGQLGTWVSVQRGAYTKNKLSKEKIQKLEALGFEWNTLDARWEKRFQELVSFKEKHGHCNVPKDYENNIPLGKWVGFQRTRYRNKKLSEDKVKRLESIGFEWNTYEAYWEQMYQELVAYKYEHGHCNVPQKYTKNPQLGIWVSSQRSAYRSNGLSKDKIRRLEELGFVWEPYEAQWEERYQELVSFKKKHGHCNVPQKSPEYPKLANWVGVQRSAHKKNKLSKDQIERLEKLGFQWNPDEAYWEQMYQELCEYKEKFGHCNVPRSYSENPKLVTWVNNLRAIYRKNGLDSVKVKRLEEIGFEWEPTDARWLKRYQELCAYKDEHGDCNVPRDYAEYPLLGKWLSHQRTAFKNGRLSDNQVRMLEDLGFVWNLIDAQWEKHYQELVQYKKKFGHCIVPAKYPENPELGIWVHNQRAYYRKNKLPEDRRKRLEAIGFEWEAKETWNDMFQELVDFKKVHGHCNVAGGKHSVNPKLATWVSVQRNNYSKGSLSQDRIRKLEELGFVWNAVEALWEERYTELKEFRKAYGHCNVPQKYSENIQLGTWVNVQRTNFRKGNLSQDRIKRLEAVGFEWEPSKRG